MNSTPPLSIMARPAYKNASKNPYPSLLYEEMQRQGVSVAEFDARRLLTSHWDILHIHWPESLLETRNSLALAASAAKFLSLLFGIRKRGTKLIWTAHDLKPHDLVYPKVEPWFWNRSLALVDGVFALSASGLQTVRAAYPRLETVPGFVTPHGHYRGVYPNSVEATEARARLGVPANATVVTFFGQIRPYKNVPQLIDVVRQLSGTDIALFVCGRLSKRVELGEVIRQRTKFDPRIRLELRYIPIDEVQLYLKAADLLVFPYKDIFNSGSALLGLSFDRPILVPNRGALPELRAAVGADWVYTYDEALTPAILKDALDWAKRTPRPKTAPLGAYEWPHIAAATIKGYTEMKSSGHLEKPMAWSGLV
jgi:glycosyltransferase involved in cell wall biosynthesis